MEKLKKILVWGNFPSRSKVSAPLEGWNVWQLRAHIPIWPWTGSSWPVGEILLSRSLCSPCPLCTHTGVLSDSHGHQPVTLLLPRYFGLATNQCIRIYLLSLLPCPHDRFCTLRLYLGVSQATIHKYMPNIAYGESLRQILFIDSCQFHFQKRLPFLNL